jgi:hypothetical protein
MRKIVALLLMVIGCQAPQSAATDVMPTVPSPSGTPGSGEGVVSGTSGSLPSPPSMTPEPTEVIVPPKPKPHRQFVLGRMTWYCKSGVSACHRAFPDRMGRHDAYGAAGPALRRAIGPGWRGTAVRVTWRGRSAWLWLIDWCLCRNGRVVDAYADVFARLAPLSRGVLGGVKVSW